MQKRAIFQSSVVVLLSLSSFLSQAGFTIFLAKAAGIYYLQAIVRYPFAISKARKHVAEQAVDTLPDPSRIKDLENRLEEINATIHTLAVHQNEESTSIPTQLLIEKDRIQKELARVKDEYDTIKQSIHKSLEEEWLLPPIPLFNAALNAKSSKEQYAAIVEGIKKREECLQAFRESIDLLSNDLEGKELFSQLIENYKLCKNNLSFVKKGLEEQYKGTIR